MTKRKSYITIFGMIVLGFAGLYLSLGQKYLPFFLHSTIYYCQNLMRSLSTLSLPVIMEALFIVLAGMFVYIGFRLFGLSLQLFREGKQFQNAFPSTGVLRTVSQELSLISHVRLIKNAQPQAVCFGIFQPKIYISSGLVEIITPKELRAILIHEKYHLDHKDNFVMLLATLVQNFLPLFPIMKDVVRQYRIQRELEADAAVTNIIGNSDLISVLKKLIKQEPQLTLLSSSGLGIFDTLETRIRYLINKTPYKPRFTLVNSIASGVFLFVLLALSLVPVQAIEIHESGVDAIMTCVSNTECRAACQDDTNKSSSMTPAQSSTQNHVFSSVPASFIKVSY